jgi:uncharacterized protein
MIGGIIMNKENELLSKALKVGGILVLVLGIVLAGKWIMSRVYPASYATSGNGSAAVRAAVKGDVQEVAIDLKPSEYAPIVVQKGIPVRFNIRADKESINSCNGTVVIPEFNLKASLKPGDNIIEFTPDKAGTIPYKCWMGMVSSSINVVDDISKADPAAIPNTAAGSGPSMPCCQSR